MIADASHASSGGRSPSAQVEPWGRILFDPKQCRACKVCEVACSIVKEGEARPSLARINVFYDEFDEHDPISGNVCRQCKRARCIAACPQDAMSRDPRTGAVVVAQEACTGCLVCLEACPWAVPKLHPDLNVAILCDLCGDQPEGPACLQMCPLAGKALRYVRSADRQAERV